MRPLTTPTRLLLPWMLVVFLCCGLTAGAGADELAADGLHPLRGAPFSDPSQVMAMPPEWVNRPIVYDEWAKREQADLAITLDQQVYLMLWEPIQRYAKEKGIRIVNQEGTCGISDGMLLRKQVDMGGFCCPPGATERLPGLRHHTLGIAAKAFIVHPKNPVANLTVDEVRGVFQGKYRTWAEVAGSQGGNAPIRVIGRLHCKLRPGHWRLLMDRDINFSPAMFEVGFIADVIYQVMNQPADAIGYETLTNIHRYTEKGRPKLLKINGADPANLQEIASLRYPFYRAFEITSWEDPKLRNPHIDGLVAFLLKEVERLDPSHGFVPVSLLRETGWQFQGDEVVGEPPGDLTQR